MVTNNSTEQYNPEPIIWSSIGTNFSEMEENVFQFEKNFSEMEKNTNCCSGMSRFGDGLFEPFVVHNGKVGCEIT